MTIKAKPTEDAGSKRAGSGRSFITAILLLLAFACTKEAIYTPPNTPVGTADATVPIAPAEASVYAPESSLPIVAPEAALSLPDSSIPAVEASTIPDATQQHPESGAVESDCLSCHGPFTNLQTASSAYLTPQGIAVNPHTTLDTQNITSITDNPHRPGANEIECDICHQPFPMPPPSADAVPEADITYCYECHHEQVFSPSCDECHAANGI